MTIQGDRIGWAVATVGVVIGSIVFALYPTVTVAGVTVLVGFSAGVVAGLLLLPSIVDHYRDGERRKALRWGLFGLGVPLALTALPAVREIGLLALVGSAGLAWELDERVLDTVR
ncbi:hypothetical protein ACFQE1_06380 [Halobium palmae]|uniref:Major facilitator superfamily (MFS) profile domain-containing protein n=1 Tax=Halobium palmae TaxID=1776492 RepID=A0ABD5RX16_9EURY